MQKKITKILFWLYIAILVWLIIFKLGFSLSALDHQRALNLIPFYYDTETSFHLREVIQNGIVFVPVGIYLKILGERTSTTVLMGFAVSLLFETWQFVFACGVSDITDLIMNTLGTLAGAALYLGLVRIGHKPMLHTVLNAVAAVATVLLCTLLVVTVAANR